MCLIIKMNCYEKLYLFFVLVTLLIGCESEKSVEADKSLPKSSELLGNLDNFNATLSEQYNIDRQYVIQDDKPHVITPVNLTRALNWRSIFLADAGGAYKGGKSGFVYGSAFSPSGAFAGAVVGGLLFGATCSGIDAWMQGGGGYSESIGHLTLDDYAIGELIRSNEIFSSEALYSIYCAIPKEEILRIKESVQFENQLEVDTIVRIVGVAHNALLERLMSEPIRSSEKPRVLNSNVAPPINPGVPVKPIEKYDEFDIFEGEFSAEMISSEIFKTGFADFVGELLQNKEQSGIVLNPAEDLSDEIMNLFAEAALLYTNTPEDLSTIINYYYENIDPSPELTEEEKQCIYIGLTVAAYSAKYWECYE